MYFIVTIDTEEDQWADYHHTNFTTKNINYIKKVQKIFDKYGVKPTYLVAYQVAMNNDSAKLLKELHRSNIAEIGAHCHPWNTPPFKEKINKYNSMLCNLPINLQLQKLKTLTSAIEEKIGIKPKSFRSGRWGYSKEVAINLQQLKYKIDTSITPYTNWEEYYGPNLSTFSNKTYFLNSDKIIGHTDNLTNDLFEVPVSIGFTRYHFKMWSIIFEYLSNKKMLKKIIIGGGSRLNFIRKVWLSPEVSSSKDMIRLIACLRKYDSKFFNFMFHSNSLYPDNTPFVKSNAQLEIFLKRIDNVMKYAKSIGCKFVTLDEFRKTIKYNSK